jgi:hypothetical protein
MTFRTTVLLIVLVSALVSGSDGTKEALSSPGNMSPSGTDRRIVEGRRAVAKMIATMGHRPDLALMEMILDQPDFSGLLGEWGCIAIFDDAGRLTAAQTLKVVDFRTGKSYPVRQYSASELSEARAQILTYQKTLGTPATMAFPILSQSLRLAVAAAATNEDPYTLFSLGRDAEQLQVTKITGNSQSVVAADALYAFQLQQTDSESEQGTKPRTEPVTPLTNEQSAAIRKILSRDFAELVEREFQALDPKKTPAPRPGFGVQISGDFDVMMRGAPELDPKAPVFHEGNAAFFHEYMSKAVFVGIQLTSASFQKDLTEVLSFKGVSAGFEIFKEKISRLEKIKTSNRHDIFQKKFFMAYLDGCYKLGHVMKDLEELQASAKRGVLPKISEIVNKVRRYSDRVGTLVYRPAVGPLDLAVRTSTWKALKKLAREVEAAARK